MKKNQILIYLLAPFIVSCGTNSNINTKSEKDQSIIFTINSGEDSSLVDKPGENTDPTKLVTTPGGNIDPTKLVTKPGENIDPTKLVTTPGGNIDPTKLVTTPGGNIDPTKLVIVNNGKGFSDILFSEGSNEVTLRVNFTEFKVLSLISEDLQTEYLEISLTMDEIYKKTIKIDKECFRNQKSFIIKIKGLKNLKSLNVYISAKDGNNKTISEKQLINEEVKGNRSLDTSFYKNEAAVSNHQTEVGNTSSNTSVVSTSESSNNAGLQIPSSKPDVPFQSQNKGTSKVKE
ncbi:MAG: hypothetical protein H7263_06060 [Candidatus Sericytochromatia bacterium]|nr:hypothetical protein [Candidatus Sericytochromatia bacterium]